MSPMRSTVRCWRWPFLRRLFWRRRFLKMMILSPRFCSSTVAVTVAPGTVGAPRVSPASPPTASTSWKVMVAPGSASSFSTVRTAFGVTRYCLPPVRITAKVIVRPQLVAPGLSAGVGAAPGRGIQLRARPWLAASGARAPPGGVAYRRESGAPSTPCRPGAGGQPRRARNSSASPASVTAPPAMSVQPSRSPSSAQPNTAASGGASNCRAAALAGGSRFSMTKYSA